MLSEPSFLGLEPLLDAFDLMNFLLLFAVAGLYGVDGDAVNSDHYGSDQPLNVQDLGCSFCGLHAVLQVAIQGNYSCVCDGDVILSLLLRVHLDGRPDLGRGDCEGGDEQVAGLALGEAQQNSVFFCDFGEDSIYFLRGITVLSNLIFIVFLLNDDPVLPECNSVGNEAAAAPPRLLLLQRTLVDRSE